MFLSEKHNNVYNPLIKDTKLKHCYKWNFSKQNLKNHKLSLREVGSTLYRVWENNQNSWSVASRIIQMLKKMLWNQTCCCHTSFVIPLCIIMRHHSSNTDPSIGSFQKLKLKHVLLISFPVLYWTISTFHFSQSIK